MAWYGITIPDGWAICDGTNGTPDLRNRFVFGAGTYSVGSIGGESSHMLTVNEIPSHTHTITSAYGVGYPLSSGGDWSNNKNGEAYSNFRAVSLSASLGYTGGGQAHNNMPPYYVLCYIMKQ